MSDIAERTVVRSVRLRLLEAIGKLHLSWQVVHHAMPR